MFQKSLILIISSLSMCLLAAHQIEPTNAQAITHQNLLNMVTTYMPLQKLIAGYLPEFCWAQYEQSKFSEEKLVMAALSPNGKFLVYAKQQDGLDNKIHVYDTLSNKNIYAFEYESGLTDLAISDNSLYIAMRVGTELVIHKKETGTNKPLDRMDTGPFNFQPNTNLLIVSGPRSIGLYDCALMRMQSAGYFNPFNKKMDYRACSANFVISSCGYQLNVHKTSTLSLYQPLKYTRNNQLREVPVNMLVLISPNEKYVLQVCLEGENTLLKIYDLSQKKETWAETIHAKIQAAAFLSDNCFIIIDESGIIKKWNLYKNLPLN